MMFDKKFLTIKETRRVEDEADWPMKSKQDVGPSSKEDREFSSVDVTELDRVEQRRSNALRRKNGSLRSRTTLSPGRIHHKVPERPKKHVVALPKDNELGEFLNDIHRILATVNSVRHNQQVIGLTSALSGEGSSTLISLLATLAAGMENGTYRSKSSHSNPAGENRILLIDAQLHNPTLHKNFGISTVPGLSDVLRGKISLEHAGHRVSSHLQVIPLGNRRTSFSKQELIDFAGVLREAKTLYDTIYIDLPSILAYPEGISLSHVCDAVILIIKARETRAEVLQNAIRKLERSGVEIMGGILNKRKFFIPDWIYSKL